MNIHYTVYSICTVYLAQKPDKLYTVASILAGTGSVVVRRFRLFWDSVEVSLYLNANRMMVAVKGCSRSMNGLLNREVTVTEVTCTFSERSLLRSGHFYR